MGKKGGVYAAPAVVSLVGGLLLAVGLHYSISCISYYYHYYCTHWLLCSSSSANNKQTIPGSRTLLGIND